MFVFLNDFFFQLRSLVTMTTVFLVCILLILPTNGFMKVGRKRETYDYQTKTNNENRVWRNEKRRGDEELPRSFLVGKFLIRNYDSMDDDKDDLNVLKKLRNFVKEEIGSASNIGDIVLEETEEETQEV